jgi:hypothetical protein
MLVLSLVLLLGWGSLQISFNFRVISSAGCGLVLGFGLWLVLGQGLGLGLEFGLVLGLGLGLVLALDNS